MFIITTQKGFLSTLSNPERGIIQFTQVDTLKSKFYEQTMAQSFIFSHWEHFRGIGAKVVTYVPERRGGAASKAFHNADPASIRKGK